MLSPPGMGKRQICKEAEKQRSVLCLWREMHLTLQWLGWIYKSCTFSRCLFITGRGRHTNHTALPGCFPPTKLWNDCCQITRHWCLPARPFLLWNYWKDPGFFYTGCGNNRRQINVSQMAKTLSKQLCYALLGVHAFTGYDTTSCFAGQGKLKALKLVQKEEYLRSLFSRFGTSTVVSSNDYLIIESIVCNWSPSAVCYLLPFKPTGL